MGPSIILTPTFCVKSCKKFVQTRWHHAVGPITSGWIHSFMGPNTHTFCAKRCKNIAYTRLHHIAGPLTSGWFHRLMKHNIFLTLTFCVKRCIKVVYKRCPPHSLRHFIYGIFILCSQKLLEFVLEFNIQIMIVAFYLWYIYAHHAYKDILRPVGPKYILIY